MNDELPVDMYSVVINIYTIKVSMFKINVIIIEYN